MTQSAIYYDLNQSPYKYEYLDYTFYFSSVFHLNKYKNTLKQYISFEESKINSKYHINLDLKEVLALAYYQKVETRGFRVFLYNRPINLINFRVIHE